MDEASFSVGDIVTRDGTDRQRVVEVGHYNDITVECVVAPERGWCAIGDRELNLAGRYRSAPRTVLFEAPVLDRRGRRAMTWASIVRCHRLMTEFERTSGSRQSRVDHILRRAGVVRD